MRSTKTYDVLESKKLKKDLEFSWRRRRDKEAAAKAANAANNITSRDTSYYSVHDEPAASSKDAAPCARRLVCTRTKERGGDADTDVETKVSDTPIRILPDGASVGNLSNGNRAAPE